MLAWERLGAPGVAAPEKPLSAYAPPIPLNLQIAQLKEQPKEFGVTTRPVGTNQWSVRS